jgi:hypothetical protein
MDLSPIHPDQLRLLLDEREISRTLIRFSRCLDTKDFDAYAALYDESGILITPWGEHRGRAGMAEHVARDLGGFAALHHVSAGHDIEVRGDEANVRTTLLATHVIGGGGVEFWSVGGHYEMVLGRVGAQWLFRSVRIVPAWRFDVASPATSSIDLADESHA